MYGLGNPEHAIPYTLCRPLLGAMWPELVRARLGAAGDLALGGPAAAALEALRAKEYGRLSAPQRLALLEALVHAAADVDAVRRCVGRWGCHRVGCVCIEAIVSFPSQGLGSRPGRECGTDVLCRESGSHTSGRGVSTSISVLRALSSRKW